MSEANAPVRLLYRHVPIAESPTVEVVGEGVFVALAAPPPVRTVLRLEHADGTASGLVVTRVVEVEGEGGRGARGFYARAVEGDALAESDRVGSEHLRTPEAGPGHEAGATRTEDIGEDAGSDGVHVAMAMPAPVVVDEDDEDDEGAPADGSEDARDAEGEGVEGSSAEGEGEADSGSRRRGRKRRAKKPRK